MQDLQETQQNVQKKKKEKEKQKVVLEDTEKNISCSVCPQCTCWTAAGSVKQMKYNVDQQCIQKQG